jgi:predicted dehydrogenase
MHIGILGTGFGKYHGELYKKIDPSIHLTFWGRNDEKLKGIQSELNCDYTTDIEEFLKNKTYDFVDICLPSQLHAEYALKALKSNHSVFIETPAVTSIEDGIKIMEAAKETGQKVLVDMFLRCNPYYRMIHDYSQSMKYGALKHFMIFRRTPPIWGKLGHDTIATSLMIHDLDFATWLGKDLKLDTFEVTTNADNTGAVIDCLLSNSSLKVHVNGN